MMLKGSYHRSRHIITYDTKRKVGYISMQIEMLWRHFWIQHSTGTKSFVRKHDILTAHRSDGLVFGVIVVGSGKRIVYYYH